MASAALPSLAVSRSRRRNAVSLEKFILNSPNPRADPSEIQIEAVVTAFGQSFIILSKSPSPIVNNVLPKWPTVNTVAVTARIHRRLVGILYPSRATTITTIAYQQTTLRT